MLERGFGLYSRREASSDGEHGGWRRQRSAASVVRLEHRRRTTEPYFSAWMNRRLAELNAEMSGTPFTDAEQAALDAVDEIAERPGMQLQASQQPGDVVWVNNLAVMHRRDRYVDHDDPRNGDCCIACGSTIGPSPGHCGTRDAARRYPWPETHHRRRVGSLRGDEHGRDERGDADEP